MPERILVTGGAGFVGSTLALSLKRTRVDCQVIALDNLKRRGSELTLPRLRDGGVDFIHGDIRNPEDLDAVGPIDWLLECSAEPSVQAGYDTGARYLIQTNLVGTINCLERARTVDAGVIFLSTSRVYPIAPLRDLPFERRGDRLVIADDASGPGWSKHGISLDFPMAGSRSLYGATKLCSEHLIEEYADMYGLRAIVNRCGVIAGPWQMGKVDQGFLTLWAARHFFGGDLGYKGFGGDGAQVRDVLHADDLFDLVALQLADPTPHQGRVLAVGGGADNSVSLRELTQLCEEATGRTLDLGSDPPTPPSDIPYYVTDNRRAIAETGWAPKRSIGELLTDVFQWLSDHREALAPLLSGIASQGSDRP